MKNYNNGVNLEIDSGCPNSVMLSQVMDYMDKNKVSNNLLEKGTWAYLGSVAEDGPNSGKNNRYLFWTSVDVNSTEVGAGRKFRSLSALRMEDSICLRRQQRTGKTRENNM